MKKIYKNSNFYLIILSIIYLVEVFFLKSYTNKVILLLAFGLLLINFFKNKFSKSDSTWILILFFSIGILSIFKIYLQEQIIYSIFKVLELFTFPLLLISFLRINNKDDIKKYKIICFFIFLAFLILSIIKVEFRLSTSYIPIFLLFILRDVDSKHNILEYIFDILILLFSVFSKNVLAITILLILYLYMIKKGKGSKEKIFPIIF